jgi:hypothetical protein
MRHRVAYFWDGVIFNWRQITGQFRFAPEVKNLSYQQYRRMYCLRER